jgi:hypothetical protein
MRRGIIVAYKREYENRAVLVQFAVINLLYRKFKDQASVDAVCLRAIDRLLEGRGLTPRLASAGDVRGNMGRVFANAK